MKKAGSAGLFLYYTGNPDWSTGSNSLAELLNAFRTTERSMRCSLAGTELADAEPNTIRNKLLKLAVKVTVSARRVYLSFAESFPLQDLFYSALKASS